jgi:hypothetical protein
MALISALNQLRTQLHITLEDVDINLVGDHMAIAPYTFDTAALANSRLLLALSEAGALFRVEGASTIITLPETVSKKRLDATHYHLILPGGATLVEWYNGDEQHVALLQMPNPLEKGMDG